MSEVEINSSVNPSIQLSIWTPTETYKLLTEMSDTLRVPVSRLILYAIDNELDQTKPFNYPLDWGSLPPFQEYQYAKEAANLLEFLSRLTYGLGVDHIIVMRRQYGIEDRQVAMMAYRELKMSGMIEEYWPKSAKFLYAKNYRYARVVKDLRKAMGNKRYKKFEGERVYKKNKWKTRGEE